MLKQGQRILAAIMFTDMVGYTALTQEDEKKSKEFRDRHREVLQNCTKKHNGKTLQYWGDGTLTIFDSAVEAVNCAIEIQRELQREPKIPLRVGIHVGDIVYDQEGIYGDGVNLASRLETLSISGGVLISYKVNDEIKNQQGLSTKSMGEFELKNVKKPIEVFAITNEGLVIPKLEELKKKARRRGRINVVLISILAVFLILVTFFIYKYGDLILNNSEKSITSEIISPVEQVKNFITDVGTNDLKSAYSKQENELWSDYNKFCSNELFGEIDSAIINNYNLKEDDSLKAIVYLEYSLYCKGERSGKYEQNFVLEKIDTSWKIVRTDDVSFETFNNQQNTKSQQTTDKKTQSTDNKIDEQLQKKKIRENLIKKSLIRREKIKRRLNK
ncbi:MAG: adenylate/guanylate cyclase domain-containing protein [Ignavibacteria bacterium]|nr:adenylate/guanylate cyclase domain-containing protein [Bacteroidota bacterium]MBL7128613.1 adenylate/guanylate cyclase domain-containing protein [Ignavibacteria bacterium]